jgi:ribosomal protein L11 methyltransferase
LVRLAVRCRPEQAETVLGEMLALAPNGVEEERGPNWVEYAIYGPPGEVPDLGEVRAAAGEALVEVTASAVPDDWADRWSEFHKPVEVAGRVRIRPSWEPPADDLLDLVIDPGRAFGTGSHATTRLCLELLLGLADRGRPSGPLADWGTGSGILAIAAAKLGWSPILACDREPTSLTAAEENARSNGVRLELRRIDLRESPPPVAPYVVANLTGPLLDSAAASLERIGKSPALLACSGMLASEADDVVQRFRRLGLGERERRVEGDWAALLLGR